MKEIAILGATASGKSALAVEIAKEVGANILSLDSLSIYKEVDIVSAKPAMEEREDIRHFGIDVLKVDDYFSAATFFDLYKHARIQSEKEGKHLIIVGGTSFYLKSMIEGLSAKVTPSAHTRHKVSTCLRDLQSAYILIHQKDPLYAQKISASDTYRIQKWYEIYFETGLEVSRFFTQNEKKPILKEIPVFDIQIDRDILRERIRQRTSQMISQGLVEEIFHLEQKYTRMPSPMKAIGIRETLDYLDGKYTLTQLHQYISTHTAQLAKRQETFNTSQFPQRIKLLNKDLIKYIKSIF